MKDQLKQLFLDVHWVEWRGRPVRCRIVGLGMAGQDVVARVETDEGANIVALMDELLTSKESIVTKIQNEVTV